MGETMPGRLTTHVLDTAHGRPAAGLALALIGPDGEELTSTCTNSDGRCDAPLLDGEAMKPGTYELRFAVGDYFRANGLNAGQPPFLDIVPIRFGIDDPGQHYHVPLLLAPYGYSTYRGS